MLIARVNGQPLGGEKVDVKTGFAPKGTPEPVALLTVKPGAEDQVIAKLRNNGKQDVFIAGDDGRHYIIQSRELHTAGGHFPQQGDRLEVWDTGTNQAALRGTVLFADREQTALSGIALQLGASGLGGSGALFATVGVGSPLAPVLATLSVLAAVKGARMAVKEVARTAENGAPGAIMPLVEAGGVRFLG